MHNTGFILIALSLARSQLYRELARLTKRAIGALAEQPLVSLASFEKAPKRAMLNANSLKVQLIRASLGEPSCAIHALRHT